MRTRRQRLLDGRPCCTGRRYVRGWWSNCVGSIIHVASQLGTVSGDLADTSGLLRQVLGSAGAIATSLETLSGPSAGGLARINQALGPLGTSLAGTRDQLGNLDTTLRSVNGHLTNICESTVINLMHGRQPC